MKLDAVTAASGVHEAHLGRVVKSEVVHQVDRQEWDRLIERFSGYIFLRQECLRTPDDECLPCYFRFYDECSDCIGIGFGALMRSRRRVFRHFVRSLYCPTLPVAVGGHPDLRARMVQRMVDYGRKEKVVSITMDSFASDAPREALERSGFDIHQRLEFVWNLRATETQLWDGMSKHHRHRIRVGGNKGLKLREDPSWVGLNQLMRLQEDARRRTQSKGMDYVLPSAQEYSLLKTQLIDNGYGSIFLADKDDAATSALLVAICKTRAYTIYSGTSDQGYRVLAPVFLYWKTALELQRRGVVEWNLGGVPAGAGEQESEYHGLFKFKERFGARQVACYGGELERVDRLRAATLEWARVLSAWRRSLVT